MEVVVSVYFLFGSIRVLILVLYVQDEVVIYRVDGWIIVGRSFTTWNV